MWQTLGAFLLAPVFRTTGSWGPSYRERANEQIVPLLWILAIAQILLLGKIYIFSSSNVSFCAQNSPSCPQGVCTPVPPLAASHTRVFTVPSPHQQPSPAAGVAAWKNCPRLFNPPAHLNHLDPPGLHVPFHSQMLRANAAAGSHSILRVGLYQL